MRVDGAGEEHALRLEAAARAVGRTAGPRPVGFYGKLVSHGDFLSRRVSDGFISTWDSWLQECMAVSRSVLMDRWLDIYLTSPVWRFACAPGACGEQAVAGVVAPSVDKVGRCFPLAIVTELPSEWYPLDAAAALQPFFDQAEQLIIETVAADRVNFEEFDAAVERLENALAPLVRGRELVFDSSAADLFADAAGGAWHLPLRSTAELDGAVRQAVSHRLAALYDPVSVWWTAGSDVVEPSCVIGRGLPLADNFVALMNGRWREQGLRAVSAHAELPPSSGDTLVDEPRPPKFRSAAATHAGRVRKMNQDSYLERPDAGLWVVADGVGGHQDGDVASRMVCDTLSALTANGSFDEMIEGAGRCLHEVNDHLARAGARPINPVVSGSTVVALMLRGAHCAILWAGDSRVYRWRNGEMRQLTRDHSVAESGAGGSAEESHAITRAVGGEATLALDLFRDRVRAGDRFLLCSDGLTRVLWESEIADWLANHDVQAAASGLIEATLDGGAPDNVTVVIVEACADSEAAS